jgi:acetyl esterase
MFCYLTQFVANALRGVITISFMCMLTSSLLAKTTPDLLVYKRVGDQNLSLHIFQPSDRVANESRAAVLVIHGGGWGGGLPSNVYRFANHFAELGYVAISVEYRLYRHGQVPVSDCEKDVRSAMRYVRSHAVELGVSPETIIVCGYSAGGHLAAGMVMFDGCDEPDEIAQGPCRPSALILYSATLDTSTEGYGFNKLGKDWERLSPLLNVRRDMPPIFVCRGSADKTVPPVGAERFVKAAVAKGNDCELLTLDGAEHNSVLRDSTFFTQAMAATDSFLRQRGLLPVTKK